MPYGQFQAQDYLKNNPYRAGQSPFSYVNQFMKAQSNPFSQYRTENEINPSINLPDPTQYFNPELIQKLFNTSAGNLGRAQGGAVSSAQQTAAALAGSGASFNPAAFITSAGSQARQPYAQAFGNLEQGRASALNSQQQALFQALMAKSGAEEQSRQFNVGDERSRQQLAQQYDMFLKNLQFQQDQTQAGALDWISALAPLLAAPVSGGTSLLGYLLPKGN